ncbi:MAG: DNA sulfur modification protein DndD [Limnohabitans sp.]|nr:DNA sulfur modification protein DndD [Limnohabitans sp.]
MIITDLHLYNFKGFKGLHKIENLDKNLSSHKNVILFGGLNGAGKTSFLEAMFLCFYGEAANKLYPSRGAKSENYNSFISATLNNQIKAAGLLNAEMYIEVFLKDVELAANFKRDISLKRTWLYNLKKDETTHKSKFEILENGKPIEEIEPEEYQERIQSLLPYNVSQFFFFDGEKIQDFASDTDNEFANSLKDVLGINLYSILANDIKQVRGRILAEFNKNKDTDAYLKEREAEKLRILESIETNKREITDLEEELISLEEKSDKLKIETRRATRITANNREDFIKEKENLENEKKEIEVSYIEQSKGILPFILTSDLFDEMEVQLEKEEKIRNIIASQKEVEPKIESIVEAIFENEPTDVKLKPNQKKYYEFKIDSVIRNYLLNGNYDEIDENDLIHNLSDLEVTKLKRFIDEIKIKSVSILHTKADRLKQIDIKLNTINKTISISGSNSDEVLKLYDEIESVGMEIGKVKFKIQSLTHHNEESRKNIVSLDGQLKKLEESVQLNKKQRMQLDYCENMQTVIKEFQKQYQAKRTLELETSIKEMWNKLTHKQGYVNRIEVLPDSNFEVKLFDSYNNEIDKTKMSAGEREIYAISLLWALVQVSGKNIPIIVDTPFGRLDSIHRKNLVENYFPQASHQVILLSQDEEIVNDYYTSIKPYIANELTIENRGIESSIKNGYPFKKLSK